MAEQAKLIIARLKIRKLQIENNIIKYKLKKKEFEKIFKC